HCTFLSYVCADHRESGDDNISGVNVLRAGDAAVRKGLCPSFCPFSELFRAVECKSASVVGVGEVLGGVLNDACEVAFVPALVCGADHFDVLRSHACSSLSLKKRKVGRVTLGLALGAQRSPVQMCETISPAASIIFVSKSLAFLDDSRLRPSSKATIKRAR